MSQFSNISLEDKTKLEGRVLSAQLESEGKKLGPVTVDEAFDLVNNSMRREKGRGANREALGCKLGCAITILEDAQSGTVLETKGENGKM
jgi:hypothetical protein